MAQEEVIVISEGEEENGYTTDSETDMILAVQVAQRPNHFRWLQQDTSVKLNLAGTDWSPRIEIEAVPSGRSFHHNISAKREGKTGRLIPEQKLFNLLNSRNQILLCIDFSSDLRCFHIMEPDSQRFIGFFTLPCFPQEEGNHCEIHIHNVIDEEIYVVESMQRNDLSIPIKSESGEELAVIMRPPPKWTASLPGLMTIHFTGDQREGLTCREKAIILGFFLSIGIQAMSHWKRSSVGLLSFYIISAFLGALIVLLIYIAVRNDYVPQKERRKALFSPQS